MAQRRARQASGAGCIPENMRVVFSRRRFLKSTAAGLSALALPGAARAQLATQPPPKPVAPDGFAGAPPVPIEVKARPLRSFDTSDHSRVRFGSSLCENSSHAMIPLLNRRGI